MAGRLGGGMQYTDQMLDESARSLALRCLDELNRMLTSPKRDSEEIGACAAALDAAASYVQDEDEDEQRNDDLLDERARKVAYNGMRVLRGLSAIMPRENALLAAVAAAVDAAASFVSDNDDDDE
jgi:hypothetical protein